MGRRTPAANEPEQLLGPPACCRTGHLGAGDDGDEYLLASTIQDWLDVGIRPARRWPTMRRRPWWRSFAGADCWRELPLNPRQVRDFARATGRLAQTDALDAQVLAHFAEAVRPELRPLPDAETQALRDLVARRRQLVAMLVAERQRRRAARAAVRPAIEAHIAWRQQALAQLDDQRQRPTQSAWRASTSSERARRRSAAGAHAAGPTELGQLDSRPWSASPPTTATAASGAARAASGAVAPVSAPRST